MALHLHKRERRVLKMRGKIRALCVAAAAVTAMAVVAACTLTTEDKVTSYNSRILEYHSIAADGTVSSNSSLNLVYRSTGTMAGKFVMTYDTGGKLIQTDCYSYDADTGDETYNGYYTYAYNTDGNITTGKTFNASKVQVQEYDVTYDATKHETGRAGYTGSATNKTPNDEQVWTWIAPVPADPDPNYRQCRTRQYFTFDSSGESLLKEYAYWYRGKGIEDYEVYHLLKGSGDILPAGRDEAYYYRSYSYDPAGNIFLQADYWYGASPTTIPTTADPMVSNRGTMYQFVDPNTGDSDPFTYNVNLGLLQDQAQTIVYAYDEYQNCVKKSVYSYGVLQEIDAYRYQDKDHIAEKSRYVDGGKTLEQRDVIRYYDSTLSDGKTYEVKEATTYYYSNASAPPSGSSAALGISRVAVPEFNVTASSDEALVAAYAERLFARARSIHE
jgi:hypothetical protein